MSESVGKRVRRLRLAAGLSQRECSSPGVSFAYISRIEAGARTPSVKALRKLADKLGVTTEYLETGATDTLTDLLLRQVADWADRDSIEITVDWHDRQSGRLAVAVSYYRPGMGARTFRMPTLTETPCVPFNSFSSKLE